jgi:hypothetical protein
MGLSTRASGEYSTALGSGTSASGRSSTAMGFVTSASGDYSTAMGWHASAMGIGSFAQGDFSVASGGGAVALGNDCTASGIFSFALGSLAQSLHDGSFVWADFHQDDFESTAANQFLIRASGGVGIGTNAPSAHLRVTGDGGVSFPQAWLDQSNPADYNRLRFTIAGDYDKRWDIGTVTNRFIIYSGQFNQEMLSLDNTGLYVRGTFVSTSDRNAKENFQPIDPQAVLAKVAALPLSKWNYKEDTGTLHIGPMAQDFHAAFDVGPDEKHIATVDADGVALAAIQGLNQKLESENAALRASNAALESRLERLERIIAERD